MCLASGRTKSKPLVNRVKINRAANRAIYRRSIYGPSASRTIIQVDCPFPTKLLLSRSSLKKYISLCCVALKRRSLHTKMDIWYPVHVNGGIFLPLVLSNQNSVSVRVWPILSVEVVNLFL